MSKLSLEVEDIVVLSDEMAASIAGGEKGEGTMGCSKPCKTTCDSESCKTTSGGEGGGCRPTSNNCKCEIEFN